MKHKPLNSPRVSRRHHNTSGIRQIKRGRTRDQVEAMATRILKDKPKLAVKVGDVLRHKDTGSVWVIYEVTERVCTGMLKRVDREVPYPYGYFEGDSHTTPTDWSSLFTHWEFADDDFTRWIKEVKEENKANG